MSMIAVPLMKSITTRAEPDRGTEGRFRARVSTFDTLDLAGDVVRKGAFSESLARWARSTRRIPVLFSHRWDDINMHLGFVDEAAEDAHGLVVRAQLDLDHPPAARAYRALREKSLSEFSFGFLIEASAPTTMAGKAVRELTKLNLVEVSLAIRGMNPTTELLGVRGDRPRLEAAQRVLIRRRLRALAGTLTRR